jgi:hypothetical protein
MAKKEEKKKLEKKNWTSTFMLIGEAKINDYTYKIDEKSEKSDWIYNHLNLGVDCGEKFGTIYSEMMGGYGSERDNVVYVHGKKEDGSDDFENRFTIDWDDRFDSSVLDSIGDLCFITVGLEKDKNGKVFYKKFLTTYDAILYIKQNLEAGMVLNVKGNLKYSSYNDNTVVKKEINSVVLSKIDDASKYVAKFTQTMLLQKDSIGKPDKDKNVIPIYAKVLDYVKEMNGVEVKGNVPFNKTFEYEIDLTNKELVQKAIDKVFKVKKGVTEITFEGDLIESGALVTVTEDDIPDDIKELIEIGAYTLEEALTKCTENTGKEKRMVLRKPVIKMVGEDGEKIPVIQKFEQKYSEEDLLLDCLIKKEEPEDSEDDIPFDVNDEEVTDTDDEEEDWLKNL